MVLQIEPNFDKKPGEGDWVLKRKFSGVISTHNTKAKAIEKARVEAGPEEIIEEREEPGQDFLGDIF